ncbi:hypothetical protein JAAARDRAFT_205416 [Jaapia argillacea MUCL 33604]|uniref:DUF1857-domain-containing protein n=1 Tax=Jaapia argillacea MUCL 33604 TaxID=933084 RepID=A0A067Q099_9AGAM|nr:hypothetical protein JAAARDRAFT_205416 [Jaapia argillacea MUCL 33604]
MNYRPGASPNLIAINETYNDHDCSHSHRFAQISQSQLWEALKIKARKPIGFIGAFKECTGISEYENGLVRRAVTTTGTVTTEDVTFVEPTWVHFKSRGDGKEVFNVISLSTDEQGRLLLTYSFNRTEPGVQPGSEEEKELSRNWVKIAGGAVEQSIKKVEELVKEGKL